MFRRNFRVRTTRHLVGAAIAALLIAPASLWGGLSARTPPASFSSGSAIHQGTDVEGVARVIDGDTLEIAGVRIRLEGIDAPEGDQSCPEAGGGTWACGQAATLELQRLVGRSPVRCVSRGTDKYGRMLAICHSGDLDINAEMIRRGLAWAFVKYSSTYVSEEADARSRRAGIWQAPTTTAWDHRAGRWANAQAETSREAPAADCIIKGNITKSGRIYHMPWSPWYAKVKIEPEKGERWFCNESEAAAAGWRPVRVN
jgi:endonuclease YncB( thermonuclease family)